MKRRRDRWHEDINHREEVARFGDAIIVRDLCGRIEIRRGTDHERKHAHD